MKAHGAVPLHTGAVLGHPSENITTIDVVCAATRLGVNELVID